jgi:uncharacterized SAM-binding protein YcdF (DUF218 family)
VAGIVWFIFSGGGAVVFLALAALWVAFSHGSRRSRHVLVAVAACYWFAAADIVPQTARELMVSGFTPLERAGVPPGRTAVVLLGSGSYQFRDWSENHYAVVDRIGAARVLEAARVFHLLDADYIISSGGLIRQTERVRAAGLTMAEALVSLGVPKERILIDAESKTTRHEAEIIKGMLAAHPVDHVVLVTSQIHMRRSVGVFRSVGVDVVPAIAREPVSIDTWWEKFIPTDKALEESALAAHEVLGLAYYAVRGWYRP